MLISHPPLDSTFCNPVATSPPSSLTHPPPPHCQLPEEQEWLQSPLSSKENSSTIPTEAPLEDIFRTASPTVHCLPYTREQKLFNENKSQEAFYQSSKQREALRTASADPCHQVDLQLTTLLDCFSEVSKKPPSDKLKEIKPSEAKLVMNVIEPEDDLKCLINNERKLELCGYYYGSLSWLDASHLLSKCKVGTFLIRDSEHSSYLYTLSVQTRRGPTSCRIEYLDGHFRLDSSKDLSHKMPCFDCVTNLVDFYVQLPKYLPQSNSNKTLTPVWLDMDEVNTLDVPVQIYKPLYKQVRSLQHICRMNVMRDIKGNGPLDKPRTMENPSVTLSKTMETDPRYKDLPNIIKDYLFQYPYSQ